MVNEELISKKECERCKQVKEIFVDFVDERNDVC